MSKFKFSVFPLFPTLFTILAQADPGGVRGRYSDYLDQLLKDGSYKSFLKNPSNEAVDVRCLETTGKKLYIGVVQNMQVKVPIQKLTDVVSDFASYVDLFPGYAAIRVDSREGAKVRTFWEQKVPVFFIPNVRYEMLYELKLADPSTRVFRYQLEKKGNVRESDGFIVLQRTSETETHYLEVDFFDADWGMLESFGPGRIWSDSVDGLYLSDLAFLLKAEHPGWANTKCRSEADKILNGMKRKPGERCLAAKASDWAQVFPGSPIPTK